MNAISREDTIKDILRKTGRISVVGYSGSAMRAGRYVPEYLAAHGYQIAAVNPNLPADFGAADRYDRLDEVPAPLDLVLIFRRLQYLSDIVDQAIALNANSIWMQLGLSHPAAAARARAAGISVVMDACMMVEHRRWETDP